MPFEQIAVTKEDGIVVITLNRPEKLNAYTRQMGSEINDAVLDADKDDHVRAIILTGTGRAFCAGADISPEAGIFGAPDPAGIAPRGEFVLSMFRCRKPIIAAINGSAIGAGLTMTFPCDFRIGAEGAKLGLTFSRIGMVPELASSWFLPKIVGMQQALRWCMSGRIFLAEEALAAGLLTELVAPDAVLERAKKLAHELTDGTSPVSVALVRQMFWRLSNAATPEEALHIDRQFVAALETSADLQEGVAALRERREPDFRGKASTDLPSPYPWW